MKKWIYLLSVLFVFSCSCCTLTSCSDDDDDDVKESVALTPEQTKERLSSISQDVMNIVNFEKDQKQLLDVLDAFSDLLPYYESSKYLPAVRNFVSTVTAAKSDSMHSFNQIKISISELIDFANFHKEFVYDDGWTTNDHPDAIVVRFPYKDKEAVIRIKCEGVSLAIPIKDSDAKLTLPEKVHMSITLGKTALFDAHLGLHINMQTKEVQLTFVGDANGYLASSDLSYSSNLIAWESGFKINGKNVSSLALEVNGENLEELLNIYESVNDCDIHTINLESSLMDDLYIRMHGKEMNSILQALFYIASCQNAITEERAKSYAQAFNQNISIELSFGKNAPTTANLIFEAVYTDRHIIRSNDGAWSVLPFLKFANGTSVELQEYLSDGAEPVLQLLKSIENLLKDLF